MSLLGKSILLSPSCLITRVVVVSPLIAPEAIAHSTYRVVVSFDHTKENLP